jgi:hypothetical protein
LVLATAYVDHDMQKQRGTHPEQDVSGYYARRIYRIPA